MTFQIQALFKEFKDLHEPCFILQLKSVLNVGYEVKPVNMKRKIEESRKKTCTNKMKSF